MKAKREARILALQVLYETDTAQHQAGEVLERHLRERAADPAHAASEVATRDYAIRLVSGIVKKLAELDHFLAQCAPDHPVSNLSPIDRNILRIALYEMQANLVPARVAINEAIEIAKQYGSDASPRFVNGALGAAMARLPAQPTVDEMMA
ncbi:MAG: transcription antitermination factor NusB [Candidatus Roseilinea sp.]|uniref:transcription antitermination factor NusB n=1 Tax=Candidatus Roseilinea sp. TaxID=2838777 RepID=UPI00404976C4